MAARILKNGDVYIIQFSGLLWGWNTHTALGEIRPEDRDVVEYKSLAEAKESLRLLTRRDEYEQVWP